MKWKIVIIAIIIVVLLSAGIVGFMWFKNSRGKVVNDGITGIANFKNIGSYESGFGVDIEAGEFPVGIELLKGSLNIKITKNDEVIFEENDIEESKNIVANIPETGYYFIMLSGKDAVGSLNYPVRQTVIETENEAEAENEVEMLEGVESYE